MCGPVVQDVSGPPKRLQFYKELADLLVRDIPEGSAINPSLLTHARHLLRTGCAGVMTLITSFTQSSQPG